MRLRGNETNKSKSFAGIEVALITDKGKDVETVGTFCILHL